MLKPNGRELLPLLAVSLIAPAIGGSAQAKEIICEAGKPD